MSQSKRRSRRFALVGIVGPVVWWLLVAVNGAITPGYSHTTEFISSLGGVGAPYAIVQQLNFAVFGSSLIAFAAGVHVWFGDGRRPRVGTALFLVFGVGVILAGVFPENAAAPESVTHVLHNVVSMIAFLAGITGVGLLTRRFGSDRRWPTYRYELFGTLLVVLVTFAVFMYTVASDSAVIGITQRLFLGVMTLWVVVQSFRLYRLSGGWERPGPETDRHKPADTETVK